MPARAGRGWSALIGAGLALTLASPAAAVDIVGAKGARGLVPENTLDGFAHALGLGVDALQIDVALTRDGVLVAHDGAVVNAELARLRGTRRWIAAVEAPVIWRTPFQELWKFDIGRIDPQSRLAQVYPEQDPSDGASIPPLAEIFGLARRAHNERVRFLLDPRLTPRDRALMPAPRAFAEALGREIAATRLVSRVTVAGLDWSVPRVLQVMLPDLPILLATAERPWLDTVQRGRPGPSPWLAGFDADDFPDLPSLIKKAGVRGWMPHAGDLSQALVAQARSANLVVYAWGVDDPAAMARLIDWGVDGIVTDYPDRLRGLLKRRGAALPTRTPIKP